MYSGSETEFVTTDAASNAATSDQRNLARFDFARLIPISSAAIDAFKEVAASARNDRVWQPHGCHYIGYDITDDRRNTGWYTLNLQVPPKDFTRGWVAGSGNTEQDERVDLVLTARPKAHGVSGRHISFQHGPDAKLRILAKREVTVNGLKRLQMGDSLILDKETGIAIGKLHYKLAFTTYGMSQEYATVLSCRPQFAMDAATQPKFSPSPATSIWNGWRKHPPQAGGGTGTVSIAYHVDDSVGTAAVKQFRRASARDARQSIEEIEMLRSLSHPAICRITDICGDERRFTFASGEADVLEIYIVPAVRNTLDNGIFTSRTRFSVWKDCLSALEYLHEESIGVMHRDIKPANIGVFFDKATERSRGILLDFGHAIRARQSSDHMKGTIRYLAPEIIALKNWDDGGKVNAIPQPTSFDYSSDIWSLGVSFTEGLWQRVPWVQVNKTAYDKHFSARLDTVDVLLDFFAHETQLAASWDGHRRKSAADLHARAVAFERAEPGIERDGQGTGVHKRKLDSEDTPRKPPTGRHGSTLSGLERRLLASGIRLYSLQDYAWVW